MSTVIDRSEFTQLIPATEADIDDIVTFYNPEIEIIQNEMADTQAAGCAPSRMTLWSPFTHDQVRKIVSPNPENEIVKDPHSKLLIVRRKIGEAATGDIVGGVIVDKDFSAWSPQELGLISPEPLHFGKFLASSTIKGLGRTVLWNGLLDYAKDNNVTGLVAEAWDFTHDGVPKDNLRLFYTSLGMQWCGTVIYSNAYYDGNIIGRKRPVNCFMLELSKNRK